MANYDPKVTEGMVAWLRSDHTDDESIRQGAELLLRINRNKGLYERILRYPKGGLKKLEYELQKHVNIRLQGYSFEDIQNLDAEIIPVVKPAVEEAERVENLVKKDFEGASLEVLAFPDSGDSVKAVTGKRPDHDQLPEDIQAIWAKNAERWKKIKESYNLLLTLNAPCDRFEHLQLLKELWYKYREDMCRYDDFRGTMNEMATVVKGGQLTEDEQRNIDVAQSYISRNLPVLQELVLESREPDFPEDKIAKLEDLRSKIQARVTSLLKLNVMLSDQRKADLMKCDISLELPQDDAQGEGSE